jgi:hypothetical protein
MLSVDDRHLVDPQPFLPYTEQYTTEFVPVTRIDLSPYYADSHGSDLQFMLNDSFLTLHRGRYLSRIRSLRNGGTKIIGYKRENLAEASECLVDFRRCRRQIKSRQSDLTDRVEEIQINLNFIDPDTVYNFRSNVIIQLHNSLGDFRAGYNQLRNLRAHTVDIKILNRLINNLGWDFACRLGNLTKHTKVKIQEVINIASEILYSVIEYEKCVTQLKGYIVKTNFRLIHIRLFDDIIVEGIFQIPFSAIYVVLRSVCQKVKLYLLVHKIDIYSILQVVSFVKAVFTFLWIAYRLFRLFYTSLGSLNCSYIVRTAVKARTGLIFGLLYRKIGMKGISYLRVSLNLLFLWTRTQIRLKERFFISYLHYDVSTKIQCRTA